MAVRSTWGAARLLRLVAAGIVAFVALFWDEALLAAPIVVATGTVGPAWTMVVGTAVFTAGGFGLSLAAVALAARRGEPPGWLERDRGGARSRWGRAVLGSGTLVGGGVAAFLLGPIVTTWLLWKARPSLRVPLVAGATSLFFGLTFVATYVGLWSLVF